MPKQLVLKTEKIVNFKKEAIETVGIIFYIDERILCHNRNLDDQLEISGK